MDGGAERLSCREKLQRLRSEANAQRAGQCETLVNAHSASCQRVCQSEHWGLAALHIGQEGCPLRLLQWRPQGGGNHFTIPISKIMPISAAMLSRGPRQTMSPVTYPQTSTTGTRSHGTVAAVVAPPNVDTASRG